MVHGIWYMVYGIWYMVYGIWYMVYTMRRLLLKHTCSTSHSAPMAVSWLKPCIHAPQSTHKRRTLENTHAHLQNFTFSIKGSVVAKALHTRPTEQAQAPHTGLNSRTLAVLHIWHQGQCRGRNSAHTPHRAHNSAIHK